LKGSKNHSNPERGNTAMFAKRFAGWLLLWVACVAFLVMWYEWQRSELSPYTYWDGVISDLLYWVGAIGAIIVVPIMAHVNLQGLRRKPHTPRPMRRT